MRVLVTGGTGFIGSHLVAALQHAGHEVVLLVRDPGRIAVALAPLGVADVRHVAGDVADPSSVEHAVRSAAPDAVVHAAALVSFEPRRAGEMRDLNTRAAALVLDAARRWGADPIVYVSSYFALLPTSAATLSADAPAGSVADGYAASKAAAEQIARQAQADGAPVVIVYPGSAWGPHDPNFGDAHRMTCAILSHQMPLIPPGALDIIDVRDLAAAVAAILDRRPRRSRYLMTGHYVPCFALIDQFAAVTGRRLLRLPSPAWAVRAVGQGATLANRLIGIRLPVSAEGIDLVSAVRPGDDSAAVADLGLAVRPLHDTFHDTVAWLLRAGRLCPRQAGLVAR